METLSMSNVSVETQAAHVAAAVAAVAQMQQEHLQQLSPNNNNSHSAVVMEQEDMQDNLVNLSDMQEIEEIQEDIVSIPKEVILISLVSQEQALYNPKHEHYRNTQRKDAKWLDIAESVGWSETQCKAKWKAMRDQYCRELKRSKFNAKANVKWKYFKELDFLRPYALSRNYRPRNSLNISNNNNNITILQNSATAIASVVSNNNNHHHQQQQQQQHQQENNKFPNIKIEAGQFDANEFVTATQIKSNDRLIATLTDEQLNVMQQQQQQDGNWNYITTTTAAALSRNNNELHINNSSGSNNSNNLHMTTTTTTAADDTLYNSFVAQITQQNNILVTTAGQIHQQHQQQQQQQLQQAQMQHSANPDEEDDDPIHTFLNYESYFEKELITMIQQEDILYNSFHPNYRNVKMKLEVWDEIARKLKKTVKQCRLKWKALRDQYIREHKRLKNRENPESLPRWKHYDALSFLQKFIKHKSGELEKNIIEIPKTEIDIDMDEPCLQSPTVSPLHVANDLQQQQQQHQQLQQQLQQALPSLSGPHTVVNNSSQQVQNTLQQQLQQSLQQQTQLLQQAQQQHQQQQQQQQHQVHDVNDEHDESLCGVASGDVSGYDDMDINDYIIGDADDGAGGPDDEDIDDDDEDIDRKSQQFPVYSPHVDTAANSNDEHEVNDDLQHQHVEFKVSHDSSLTQAQTPNSHSLSQQSTAMQQHLQQHQQHMINIDNDDNTQQQQQNEQNFADSLQASLLNGTVTTATTTATTAAKTNEVLHAAIAGVGITVSSTHNAAVATTTNTNTNTNTTAAGTDDDEVGAFFKAVAMKIRNAKMSPVAFTDLQIDILRVINGTLRNH